MLPRPVRSFVGRRAELDRALARLDRAVCFFVYGVAGIGKSEFVYRLLHEARERPQWSEARTVHLEIHAGAIAPRALADLLVALGSRRRVGGASRQLELIAELLDARPHLVFIDDVHHLPSQEVGEALGFLSRHVQNSRLFVASRREVPLSRDARPPVITTLGPLDDRAAGDLISALGDHASCDSRELVRAAHGSPFFIRRAFFRGVERGDTFDFADLPAEARRTLLMVSVARFRAPIAGLPEAALRTLTERFLVEVEDERLVVHDLVREAILGAAAPGEIAAAHADAANFCLDHLRDTPLSAVDAVSHLLLAERFEEAFEVVERSYPVLRASGAEHLLLDALRRLRETLPTRQARIDLLVAHTLARASLFDESEQLLSRISEELDEADRSQRAALLGEIALHRGDSATAMDAFERAAALAPDPDARFQVRLRLATAATLALDGGRGREILAAALAEHVEPTARQRARHDLALTFSWVFDEQFERAAEIARAARRSLPPGHPDLASRLSMLETLAAIESEDLEQAREAARHIDAASMRRKVAALYRAILAHAEGCAADVADELVELHRYLFEHGDAIHGTLAGHHGSAALAEIGRLGDALELAERTARLAEQASLHGPAARARAQQALLAAESMQAGLAHELADRALQSRRLGPRSRARAHVAHSRAFVIGGETARALEHLAEAHASVAALPGAEAEIRVEQAAADLVGGSLDRAVDAAERAVSHYRDRSRRFQTAHALLVLAAARIARGRPSDDVLAARTLGQARELADRGRFRGIQVGCVILTAALARRSAGSSDPMPLLSRALLELDPERGSVYAGTLVAAIDGGIVARAVPGVGALLAHLGFAEAVEAYLVDRHGRRAASATVLARERVAHDLFIDVARAVLLGRRGEIEIAGRPRVCAMLSAFVHARGATLSPEALYTTVWGVREYHPLRHRSALYVGINRLRACLREIYPERELIERADEGWRLCDDVDACVAIPVRT